MRSGAASVVFDATDPASMPISKPTASATRADSGSNTLAGDKHFDPAINARSFLRCSLWFMICGPLSQPVVACRISWFLSGARSLSNLVPTNS